MNVGDRNFRTEIGRLTVAVPPAEAHNSACVRPGLVFDTLTVSALTAIARIMGAAKAVALARVFGAGAALDTYLLAFLVPSFLADVFCGSLVPVLVPKLVELRHRDGEAQAVRLYSEVLRRSLWFSWVAAAAVAGAAALIAMLEWGNARMNVRLLGVSTILMAPILPLAAVANIWRAVLNSQGKFAIPALTIPLAPIIIIVAILLAGRSHGVWILAAATSIASLAEVLVLASALRRTIFPILPRSSERTFSLIDVRREYSYLAAATAMSAGTGFIGQSMAALGAGSVSILNYGTRLAGVLMAIGPAALSVTLLPRFSQMAAARDWESLKTSLWRILWGSLAVAAVSAAFLIAFSVPIVRFTLQRGAFTPADTRLVASVQAVSLIQLPFILGITILMRVLSALKANRILLPFSGAALVVSTGLNYALMSSYGVTGLALAASSAQVLLFAALSLVVFRRGLRGFLKGRDA